MSDSALGGYLTPSATSGFPSSLNLNQFIQTVIVGLTGLDGKLVRPKWQIAPPKNPDIGVNWIAFGINTNAADAHSFVGMDANGITKSQRHEGLEIGCSFYGPDALEYASILRDGFEIQQNLEAMRSANMGFTGASAIQNIPELVGERFVGRSEMTISLKREVQRTYSVLSLLSATGTVHTVLGSEEYIYDWTV